MNKTQRVYADIYDAIISHLLDEGYVDCLGSAEIILENMSDKWFCEIMERKYDPNEPLPGSGLSPLQKYRRKRKNFKKKSNQIFQGSVHPLYHPDDQKETGRQRAKRMTRNFNIGILDYPARSAKDRPEP